LPVGRRPAAAGGQGGGAADPEVAQDGPDGVAAVAQVGGNLRRRPAGGRQRDHLQAVTDSRREVAPAQGIESLAVGVVERDPDHPDILGNYVRTLRLRHASSTRAGKEHPEMTSIVLEAYKCSLR